jgi:hypothetical protein
MDHCDDAVDAGHFFPEEAPEVTAKLLRRFFRPVAAPESSIP